MLVPLCSRPFKGSVRRIYVRHPIVVPNDTSVNVPVRLPFVNVHTPKSDWLTEPQVVRPGLLAARTLLSHNDRHAAIAFMNVSGVDQPLRPGHALGLAISCSSDAINHCKPPSDTIDAELPVIDERIDVNNGNCGDETFVKCAAIHTADAPLTADRPNNDYSHIQPVIDTLPESLTAEQREEAIALIKRDADVFSRHEFDVGCACLLCLQ